MRPGGRIGLQSSLPCSGTGCLTVTVTERGCTITVARCSTGRLTVTVAKRCGPATITGRGAGRLT